MADESELYESDHLAPGLDANRRTFLSVALPILALVFATAALYRGRDVLLPITAALILAVICSPMATLFEPWVGRFVSAALVVVIALSAIVAVTYFLTVELTEIADKVSGYSTTIANKLVALERREPVWLTHTQHAVSVVQQRLQGSRPSVVPRTIQAAPSSGSMADTLRPLLPVLDALVSFLLIIGLLFFLLYTRRDLRDRFVRLTARARLTVANQALEAAGDIVARYLLLFTLVNLVIGILCGTAAWLLGLPNAPLWGLLAFLLRFIPYVGMIVAAVLPGLVAFAIFPGWSRALGVVASFVFIDQASAQFAEPILIGRGIDLSPVALLIAALYWSWLWGLPGLLLATPLTVCLKVAGDHMPALDFLSLLLAGNRRLDDYHDFYRLLLEMDQDGARRLAITYCDENGLQQSFKDILTPAIALAGEEHAEQHISDDIFRLVIDTTRGLITDLGARSNKPRRPRRTRILGFCAPGERHDLGVMMLLELMRNSGAAVKFIGAETSVDEIRETVRRFAPQLLWVSCTMADRLPAAEALIATLKRDSPNLTVVAGGAATTSRAAELLHAGCTQVYKEKEEVSSLVRRFALQ